MTTYPTDWQDYDPKSLGVYGEEAKCWQTAVFDQVTGEKVGVTVQGTPGYTGRDEDRLFKAHGLIRRVRQTKQFTPRSKRNPERKETMLVRIETYDRDGNLTDLSVESRMVYWNSKGPFIKTRSNGNPRITERRGDTMVIIYRPKELVYAKGTPREYTRWAVKPVEPTEVIE